MPNIIEKTVQETAEDNKKSLIEAVKDAFRDTKVSQSEVETMKNLANDVGIKNYKDLFAMKEIKPTTKLERFINAKIYKLGKPKKVTEFLANIARSTDEESLAQALGIPKEKLIILVPTPSFAEIFTDLFKKYIMFAFTYFIFNFALTAFKAMTGVGAILAKCASHKRTMVNSSFIYHKIRTAGVKFAATDDVPYDENLMDVADQTEYIDNQLAENAEMLKEKIKQELVKKKIEEIEKALATRDEALDAFKEPYEFQDDPGAVDLDFTEDPDFLNPNITLDDKTQEVLKYLEDSKDYEFGDDIDPLDLAKETMEKIEQEAYDKAHKVVYSKTPDNIYDPVDRKLLERGALVSEDPEAVKAIAEAKTKSEVVQIADQASEKVQSVPATPEGGGGYTPNALECKALGFASYSAVKILLAFFSSVAKGAFQKFKEFGLEAFLASAFTAMFVFGEGFFGKVKKVISDSANYVKGLASKAWDFIRGERKLRLAMVRTAGGVALPSDVYSKMTLSVTDYVKEKYEEIKKHLSTRSIENMRKLAGEVGRGFFSKISQGEEIKPSNKVEALIKAKLDKYSKPEQKLEIISRIQESQSEQELAQAIGVPVAELQDSYKGVVNTRGWDYSIFIGKAFLLAMYTYAVFSIVSTTLGFGGGMAGLTQAINSTKIVTELTAVLAPLKGVLSYVLGADSIGAVIAGIAKSSAISALLMTTITGIFLYGPRWIRNTATTIKDWLVGEVKGLFKKMTFFNRSASEIDANMAMSYFLQPAR